MSYDNNSKRYMDYTKESKTIIATTIKQIENSTMNLMKANSEFESLNESKNYFEIEMSSTVEKTSTPT